MHSSPAENYHVYNLRLTPDERRYIASTAHFHFIWLEKPGRLARSVREMPAVKFGVTFSISCEAPFHSICLAYMLLRFCDENIRNGDYHIFKLESLCFRYAEHGIYGVMLFNRPFKWAVREARAAAILECNGFYLVDDTICSRWMGRSSAWVDDGPLAK
ncbi:hypothetical protein CVT26_005803 [Gymnopilus dilepis]|uniref:Uncharacterized protein n=1 Tax=Gymnopilus dilepis TaxID=231916 RepID=A0A409YL00_9AGAR|nr:hypothetical protein CVT26_005803 [Gymnopilus dilepis]